MIMFDELIGRLPNQNILLTKIRSNKPYLVLKYLCPDDSDFDPETIYLGKASMLTGKIDMIGDAGFILLNDCVFDFSHFEANFMEFPEDTDIFKLFNEIQDIVSFKSKMGDISATLLDTLAKRSGLNYLIRKGAELLGNPIMFVDVTGRLQDITTRKEVEDKSWMDVFTAGCIPQSLYSNYKSRNYTMLINSSSKPVIIDFGSQKYLRKIAGKISVKNKIVGHIVVLESDREFRDEEDLKIAKVIIDAMECELQKNKIYETMNGKHHEYLIIDLLKEKKLSTSVLEEWTESLQKVAPNDFYTVVINLPKNRPEYYFLEFIRNSIESFLPYSKSVYFEEKIILLINCDEYIYPVFIEKLSELLNENELKAGISLKFSSIGDMKKYYTQALKALELGKLLKKETYLLAYDDFLVYDLLTQVQGKMNLDDFCNPCLRELLDYDTANNTDYYRTLHEYLLNGLNASSVAREFHTHKNTIIYRINKISELTGINLKSGDDCFKLYLSYLIHDLMYDSY